MSLVVAALVAGATAGVSETAATAVGDAYRTLKNLVIGCFRRGGVSDDAGRELIGQAGKGDAPRAALERQLSVVQVDEPTAQVAQQLLDLLEQASTGKFHVELNNNTGVQVGDQNQQTININPR
ncbi:hypothetical protein [Allorhizocola rhizosphaerae]|uniref:hypothetical protein n=1 Tax=Allorhizocola rhizosphaerae TaxID=1872709 RepID=UPI0013C30F5A|nr:hypothetical protein [Allorhizocola rhizosphaerae]